jgi:hypothetical protein
MSLSYLLRVTPEIDLALNIDICIGGGVLLDSNYSTSIEEV